MNMDKKPLFLDGACGTTLQKMAITAEQWGDYSGCNEYLNLGAPEIIEHMHASFVAAGADAVETNTFGAAPFELQEYGLADKAEIINHRAVEIARAAGAKLVIGSIGPGKKLPTLGQVDFTTLRRSFLIQMNALAAAGADALLIETAQDLLQVKAAISAARQAVRQNRREHLPIMVSLTFMESRTMLTGSGIAAAVAALRPFKPFSIGLNCSTGPEHMAPLLRQLRQLWDGRISCVPNQGLPSLRDGELCYDLTPRQYAQSMLSFYKDIDVDILGGCCGTSAEHIRVMKKTIAQETETKKAACSAAVGEEKK